MADINVDYSALDQESAKLQQDMEEITQKLQQTENRINALTSGPFKTQIASGKFNDSHRQWNQSNRQSMQALGEMATYLKGVSQSHQGLDSQLASGAGA